MNYLSENVTVYQCPRCLVAGEAHVWVDDPYIGLCCGECGDEVKFSGERPATWWSVGVYETGRSYGGPEEGGWWYDTGSMIDHFRVRGFDNFEEAKKYQRELRDHYAEEKNIGIVGFTEKLPVAGYPARRPVYC